MRTKTNLYAVIVLTTALVVGCGSEKGAGVGPTGSHIVIAPSAIGYTYPGSAIPGLLGPTFVTVSLLNASNNPVRGASVTLFNGGDTIAPSDRTGTVGSFQFSPFVGTTDDFGNVYIYVTTTATTTIGASSYDFEAFSGGAFTTMTITTTCTDTNTATATVCD